MSYFILFSVNIFTPSFIVGIKILGWVNVIFSCLGCSLSFDCNYFRLSAIYYFYSTVITGYNTYCWIYCLYLLPVDVSGVVDWGLILSDESMKGSCASGDWIGTVTNPGGADDAYGIWGVWMSNYGYLIIGDEDDEDDEDVI